MAAAQLAEYAEQLSSATLRTHLAALEQWHTQRGFEDPTKQPQVRDVLRGIRAEHPRPIKQDDALPLQALEACVAGLQALANSSDSGERLRACRDQALILLGFWRALRSDDLCRLRIEHIQLLPGQSLEVFLASDKTDRHHDGKMLSVPALKRLCPVEAYEHWLEASGLQQGPVFRASIAGIISDPAGSIRTAYRACCAWRLCATVWRAKGTTATPCAVVSRRGPAVTHGGRKP